MNSHLDIGQAVWSGNKAIKLPEQGSNHSPASSFQHYLDKGNDDGLPVSPEKLTPDAIHSLALALISALDDASMKALFFDADSSSQMSSSSFLSTDLFMAMRNSMFSPVAAVEETQASQEDPVVSVARAAALKPEQAVAPEAATWSGSGREQYAALINQAAERYGLDAKLIESVIQTESDFNAQAVSPVGAQGLMQLMPGTAADLGVTDAFDPEQNIQGGSKYLKQLMDRYDGDTKLALAAYNWGMGNLERHPERMPLETVNYVAKITGMMNNAA